MTRDIWALQQTLNTGLDVTHDPTNSPEEN